eukprot:9489328-Pyramimonas_sp.AAC.2
MRIMEYDMVEFFKSCISLYAELTYIDEDTYPLSGAPFGPELTSFEGGQGGRRGEVLAPAEEALAECLRIDAVAGPPGAEVHVAGPPMDGATCP